MTQDLQDEWTRLEQQALEALRAGVERPCLFRVVRHSSFDASLSWHVCLSPETKDDTYFALYRRWRRDIDGAKFRSPVERLKHPRPLTPTIESGRVDVGREYVEEVLERARSMRIPALVANPRMGCDGETYEIRFGDFFLRSQYSWWVEPPEAWRPLGEIVDGLLLYLNARAEFQT